MRGADPVFAADLSSLKPMELVSARPAINCKVKISPNSTYFQSGSTTAFRHCPGAA
jgi:hypothetical protein